MSIEQGLKIILYGKSGKPVKTLKAAKYYEIYYKKDLVLVRSTRHKIQENKRLAIEKAYTDVYTYIFFEQKILKDQIKQLKIKVSPKAAGTKVYINKIIDSKKYKAPCSIRILDFTLHHFIKITRQTNKRKALQVVAKLFKPYIIEFINKMINKGENIWLFRIKYDTKRPYKKRYKIFHQGFGLERITSNNKEYILRKSIVSINNVFKEFEKKLNQYINQSADFKILITGFTFEYMLRKDV